MKIGRNEPCICGSGKKYKHCCINKNTESYTKLPEQLEKLTLINNAQVQDMLSKVKNSRQILNNPDYWNELGCELGRSDLKEEAILIFKQASKIDPNYWSAKINLAGTLSDIGQNDEALKLLNTVPSGEYRHALMMANILRAKGRYPEAIIWYETAIKEESDFSFAYTLLLDCLEHTNSPSYDIWLQRAIQKASDQAIIILRWAKYLYVNERFSELSESIWITDLLKNEHNSNDRSHELLLSAEAWRLCAQARLYETEEALHIALNYIVEIHNPDICCDQASALSVTAATLGHPDIVIIAHNERHSTCITTPLETYLAHAYRNANMHIEAIQQCETLLKQGISILQTLEDYWWCLDETNQTDESISALKHLLELSPEHEQARIEYNLGYLYSKSGRHGSATIHFQNSLNHDSQLAWARECLAVMKLLDQEYDESLELMKDHVRSNNFNQLVTFARSIQDSNSYSNDIVEKSKTSYNFCCSTRLRSQPFSPKETLHIIEGRSSHETLEDLKRYFRALDRGDYSHAVYSLKNQISCWNWLPDAARAALVEAEHRYHQHEGNDYSPIVVSYSKAVEIMLKYNIFDQFRNTTSADSSYDDMIMTSKSESRLASFTRYLEHRGYLEMGGMIFVLRLTAGKTGKRVELLTHFMQYIILSGLHILLDNRFLDICEELSKLRNPAAHEKICSEADAFQARGLCMNLLRQLVYL